MQAGSATRSVAPRRPGVQQGGLSPSRPSLGTTTPVYPPARAQLRTARRPTLHNAMIDMLLVYPRISLFMSSLPIVPQPFSLPTPTHTPRFTLLYWLSIAPLAVACIIGILITAIYGPDPFSATFLIITLVALLGVARRSGAGQGMLTVLLILEGLYAAVGSFGAIGLSALTPDGFHGIGRAILVLFLPFFLTLLSLTPYTLLRNRLRISHRTPSST